MIDLYQIHKPSTDEAENREGWETLVELRKKGKVRWIGVSNLSIAQLQMAREIAGV